MACRVAPAVRHLDPPTGVGRIRNRIRRRRLVATAALAGVVALTAAVWSLASGSSAVPGKGPGDRTIEQAAKTGAPGVAQRRAASPAPKGSTVTFAWGGDTVLGSVYGMPADDGYSLLEHVAPIFRASDVGWVNLEEALASGTSSKCGGSQSGDCFAFGAPPAYAASLQRAGIRIVNLANNHDDDYGEAGQESTLAALRAAHVAWDGKPGEIEVLTVNRVRVAFLGFAPYPWASRLDDIPAAVALVRRAAREANVVVVAIHAGAEGSDQTRVPHGTEYYLGENRGNSRAFAHAVIDAGADLVVGSGPHVIRGVEWYHGRPIAYSLGNLAGWHTFGLGGTLSESAILTVTLRGDGSFVGGHWTPLVLLSPGIPEVDPRKTSLTLVEQLSREDFGAGAMRFDDAGKLLAPAGARR